MENSRKLYKPKYIDIIRFLSTVIIITIGIYLTYLITDENGILYTYYFMTWPMIDQRFSILYSVSIFCSMLFIALCFLILSGESKDE